MEEFNEPRSELKGSTGSDSPYQPRKYRTDKGVGKKSRWVLPFALLLTVIIGISIFWYLGGRNQTGLPNWFGGIFSPGEKIVHITLPEALFSDNHVEEVITRAIQVQGIEEIARDEDGVLTYAMTTVVRDRLLKETENDLLEKLASIRNEDKDLNAVDVSYDSTYKDFHLIMSQEQDQNGQALLTASELFMMAVYYQYLNAAAEPVPEVAVTIEYTESGSTPVQLVYPADLNRVAAILEEPAERDEAPATPQPGDKVIVATGADNLNLRNGPEITYLIIDILSSGTVLEVTGSEGLWLEVITPEGVTGWVHGDFVKSQLND